MDFSAYDNFKIIEPYYSGYRLLSTPDRSGAKPEIFVSTTNRSAGKTVFYNGWLLHQFIKTGKKFLLLFRNKYEIDNAAENFFSQIGGLFYTGLHMSQERGIKNVFDKIYLAGPEENSETLCGYATSLRASEQIKKYSSMLSEVEYILFDEAFPEDGGYLPDEIQRLMSIHDSLARGGGSQSRYLPLIVVGNLIDVFNPLYEALGIVDDLTIKVNYMRGDGWVVEQGYNEASAQAHKESGFHRALAAHAYTAAAQDRAYLNTSYLFIDNDIADEGFYICTIVYKKKKYSVRYNESAGFYYVGVHPDPGHKLVQAATEADISDSAIYDPLSRSRKLLKKKYRENGIRFKSLEARNALMHFVIGK